MSDWLERELSRALAPVAAPDGLRVRLGLAPANHREFPRMMIAVATAVLVIIGGGYAASQSAALDLRRESAVGLRPAEAGERAVARLVRCDGGAAIPAQLSNGDAIVLLAHSSSDIPAHHLSAAPEAGCHLCHSL
jgi:hypothetical protein